MLLGRFQRTRGMYCLHFRIECSLIKGHDKSYCKLLSDVIKEAKRLNYDTHIINFNYTVKSMWEIVMLETGRKAYNDNIHSLNVDGNNMIRNQQTVAGTSNNCFLSVAENLIIHIVILIVI